ncbi:MAG: HisA/HisF-related TIM barrel protein [Gammaproteobacteria bacterium]
MQIIPVIDIRNGAAVHARQGDRARYRPLVTRFATDARPESIIDGLLAAGHAGAIYIADLDAIERRGGNTALLARLAAGHPAVRLLVDVGLDPRVDQLPGIELDNVDLVIASESLASMDDYAAVARCIPRDRQVLSLDRRGAQALGPPALFTNPTRWPRRVIHMDLDKVGSGRGPDIPGLAQLRAMAPACDLIAAGGVRNDGDLTELAGIGVQSVLVGTALHDGTLRLPAERSRS